MIISEGYNAAIGENILMARPDSPQFSLLSFISDEPLIFSSPESGLTIAPSPAAMLIAASESSQYEGLMMVVSPSVSTAAAIARCVMLFEDGAFMLPVTLDGLMVLSMSASLRFIV
jgi:hypothetical protein